MSARTLPVLVILGISVVTLLSCNAKQESTEDPKLFANVSLSLKNTNYGELKRLLLDAGQSDRRPGDKPLYNNAVRIEWTCGISATFVRTSQFPSDSDIPISLSARGRTFQGSICGVHLGDSVEGALRECGCATTDQYKTLGVSHIYADCRDRQTAEIIASDGKIESIDLKDKDYQLQFGPRY